MIKSKNSRLGSITTHCVNFTGCTIYIFFPISDELLEGKFDFELNFGVYGVKMAQVDKNIGSHFDSTCSTVSTQQN